MAAISLLAPAARQERHLLLGVLYFAGFSSLSLAAWSLGVWGLWLLWPASSCLLVAAIYVSGRPELFRKENGSIPAGLQCLLAPYLLAARVNVWCWTHGEPEAGEIAPGVWVGRLPHGATRFRSIVDITAELPLAPGNARYENIPVLDLTVPNPSQIGRAVAAIERLAGHRPTLVCCALGYSRSAMMAVVWLVASRRVGSVDEGIALLRQRRPRIALSAAHRAALADWAGERSPSRRSLFARAAGRAFVLTARALLGAEPRWIGCQPHARPRVYIANHTSHADLVVLWSALPPGLRERTRPVAAADYWRKGRVRRYVAERIFDAVMVARDHIDRAHNPLQAMAAAIAQGDSLIVFPEGRRGPGGEPAAFKCGIYHLARHCPEAEIVPVWISNLHRAMPRGAVIPAPLLSSVTFGVPMRLAASEDKGTFLARLRRAVIETEAL